jgi:hypothetical protein
MARSMKKTAEQTIVDEARDAIADSYEADRHNRLEMATDLRFVAGDQWPSTVRTERDAAGRPMLTFNLMPQFIRQVSNDVRQADISIKVSPVDDNDDPELAELYNGILQQIQYRSSAKHVYANAAESQIACGMGYWRIVTQYTNDDGFDQEILLKRIANPLSVYMDPGAIEPDRSDATWCAITEMVPRKSFKARYPKAQETDIDVTSDSTTAFFWSTRDAIRIAEYWKRTDVPKVIGITNTTNPDGTPIVDETGKPIEAKTIDVTGMDPKLLEMAGIRTRKAKGYKVEQWIVSGKEVLEGPNEWAGSHIPIIAVVGEEIPLENLTVVRGMVRSARDPQQLFNFQMTAGAESVALAPKAPYLVTPTMIGPHKAQWDAANTTPRPYLVYTPDDNAPGGRPIREHPPEMPTAMMQMSQMSHDLIKSVTGIHDASLGAQGNETSGRAIRARQMEGDTANFHFKDNLEASLAYCGRQLIELIPKVYDNERVLRITGDQDKEERPVTINTVGPGPDGLPMKINDLSAGNFDVRVTIGQSFATKRLETMDSMMQLLSSIKDPNIANAVTYLAVKNMDWPGAEDAAKMIKNALPPGLLADPEDPSTQPPPPPDPMQDPIVRTDVELKQAQTRKTLVDAAKGEAELMAGHPVIPQPPQQQQAEQAFQ